MKRHSYYIKPANIDNLELVEENIADPGPSEVQVEIKAIGLNFADVFSVLGLYEAAPKGSFIPGLEYSGIITKTGEDVEKFHVGDRVIGIALFGAYTTIINSDFRHVTPMKDDWNFAEGASYLVQALTAYYGLVHLCRVKENETVLIHSAAGGVGIMVNRIAKKFNCFTIGTVGNKGKVDFCLKEGYDKVIVRDSDFNDNLREALSGRNLDIVMECIGGKIFKESLKALGRGGRMAVYGFAHYLPKGNRKNYFSLIAKYLIRPRIDIQNLDNKSVSAFNLIYMFNETKMMQAMLLEMERLDLGRPAIGEQFEFKDLKKALLRLKSGATEGKVVVIIQQNI